MRRLRSIIASGVLVIAAGAQTNAPFSPAEGDERNRHAYDPFDPHLYSPRMVRVQVEYIQVTQSRYLELIAEKRKSANATSMRKKLQGMVMNSEAKVLETSMVVARSGGSSTIESIGEFIFPTEYEPPGSIPFELTKDQQAEMYAARVLRIPITPFAFETKNLGTTLEIEPVIGFDNQSIDLRFAPELVAPAGFSIYLKETNMDDGVHQSKMPYFIKNSVNTAITCIDGQYHLVGVLTPSTADGQLDKKLKVMVFVRCNILVVTDSPLK